MRSRQISMIGTVIGMTILILDSRHMVLYAGQGIDLCLKTVIPSLFPFFLLSIYLTGNLPSGSGTGAILIAGFLGGYPVGAHSAAESWRSGRITKAEAERLLLFCNQAGPSFLFGMAAARFPEPRYAWMLWGVQLLSALTIGIITFVPERHSDLSIPVSPRTLTTAMQMAIRSMASVCGWVVVFRVLLGYLAPLPLGNVQQVLLYGLLELSNGCILLDTVENLKLRFLLATIMLNFGGLCVALQTASVIRGLDLRIYLRGKLLQTALSLLYCMIFWGSSVALILLCAFLLLAALWKSAKRGSIPAWFGV